MRKYKVALIHNIIAPYRVPLFEGLSDHPSIDLSVYYCSKIHKIRKWDILESRKYHYEILPGYTLELGDITYHINPSIISTLRRANFDVVIIGGAADFTTQIAFFISKLTKTPVILWSEGIESSQSLLGKVINPLTKYIIRNVGVVVVTGTLSSTFHAKMGADPRKIFIAPNIVDNEEYIKKCSISKLHKKIIKDELGIKQKKAILFVGQLIRRKGIDLLIEAYDNLRKVSDDICLIILGEGSLEDEMQELCKNNDIPGVYFAGWIDGSEKISYYPISDLLFCPR